MNASLLSLISSFAAEAEPQTSVFENTVVSKRPNLTLEKTYGILCFSKDRPLQLDSFLDSLKKYFLPQPDIIEVLYTSSEEWSEHYNVVFSKHSDVIAQQESHFSSDFQKCIDSFRNRADIITLCVDDMVFFREVPMR